MNCIIIEDDPLSVRIIQEFIRKTTDLNLVHTFSNAIDAINILQTDESIELIFLDIELPEMSGIEFLDSIKEPPQVIIISSKGLYAADAFDYDVADYLVKPITYARFYKAIQRARKRLEKDKLEKVGRSEIFIKKDATLVRLKYSEILWIEALENYVIFNTFNIDLDKIGRR